MKAAFVLAMVAACGGTNESAPPPPAPPQPTGCPPNSLVASGKCMRLLGSEQLFVLEHEAAQLAAVGKQLAATEPVEQAGRALAALHQLDQWKRHAAAAKFEVIDIAARLHDGADKLHALGARFTSEAVALGALHDELAAIAKQPGRRALDEVRALVSDRIVATFPPLGEAITVTIVDIYEHYQQQILGEIVLLNERVCAKDDPALREACKHAEASAAFDYLEKTRRAARHELDEVGLHLEAQLADLLDERAKAAIERATLRGPSFGEPCGLDGLCKWELGCESYTSKGVATKTCEFFCRVGAMQPCLGGTHCTKIDGLDREVCRP